MGNFVVVVTVILLIGAWYFWKKKPNKKALIACVILAFVFGGLYSTTDDYTQGEADQAASSSKLESSKNAKSKKESVSEKAKSKKESASESKSESKKNAKSSSIAASKASKSNEVSKAKKAGIKNDDQAKMILKKYDPYLKIKDLYGDYADSGKELNIDLKGSDNFTAKMTLRGFWRDTASIWKALKKSGDASNFNKVVITVDTELEDTAGNSSMEHVLRTSLSGANIQKFNIKHFKYINVPKYADYYWQSNAFPNLNE